jgi:hypothetical protein
LKFIGQTARLLENQFRCAHAETISRPALTGKVAVQIMTLPANTKSAEPVRRTDNPRTRQSRRLGESWTPPVPAFKARRNRPARVRVSGGLRRPDGNERSERDRSRSALLQHISPKYPGALASVVEAGILQSPVFRFQTPPPG